MPRRHAPALTDPLRGRSYLEAHFGISPSTRRRWSDAGLIPVPDRIINGRPFWFESTVHRIGCQPEPEEPKNVAPIALLGPRCEG